MFNRDQLVPSLFKPPKMKERNSANTEVEHTRLSKHPHLRTDFPCNIFTKTRQKVSIPMTAGIKTEKCLF